MSAYLLDTNCISELVRAEPDPGVMTWLEAADEGAALPERFDHGRDSERNRGAVSRQTQNAA